ncbi:uncharacterized protein C10orf105-like isoform X2 [Heptranchias perlo]|uniref:uncharacterized protein C10orf105-like isoform X2 n=1 Tax=Heptranchias perlo TaxID=212740 RepID=UPI003559A29C
MGTMNSEAKNGTTATSSVLKLLLTTAETFQSPDTSGLDASRYRPYECMPYHIEDSSEPRLKLWKRFGSLRRSINSFRRIRSFPQPQQTFTSHCQVVQNDSDLTESTKM